MVEIQDALLYYYLLLRSNLVPWTNRSYVGLKK